jgi:hypothetical protein
MARLEGFEPPTFSFEGCRSIHLSYRRATSVYSILLPPGSSERPQRTDIWSYGKKLRNSHQESDRGLLDRVFQ